MDTPSDRTEILHNIDDIWGSAALTVNDWKVIKGTNYRGQWDFWYGPAGVRNPASYSFQDLAQSPAGQALQKLHFLPDSNLVKQLREDANVNCTMQPFNMTELKLCRPLESPCLFNIREDPCEQFNLADR